MSAYLLIKAAYVQAFVLELIVPPFLWQFSQLLPKALHHKVRLPPLSPRQGDARCFNST